MQLTIPSNGSSHPPGHKVLHPRKVPSFSVHCPPPISNREEGKTVSMVGCQKSDRD